MWSGFRFVGKVVSRGSIHIPRHRSRDCSSNTESSFTEKAWRSVQSWSWGRDLFIGTSEGYFARHSLETGQTPQSGRDLQTSAPRSIKAEL